MITTQTQAERSEWFWMLVSYVKVHSLRTWLYYYPDTTLEVFEQVWPLLFDGMLSEATNNVIRELKARGQISCN